MKETSVVCSDPDILGGTAVFVGTRVPAQTLFDYLKGGETLDEFLHQFPSVKREQALAAIELARDSVLGGKKTRASRTWQMIQRRGIIPAVEVVVSRHAESAGYATLVKMGLEKMAFEAVVLRDPEIFSAAAVLRSKQRLQDWLAQDSNS